MATATATATPKAAPVIRTIPMADGRKVEFMGKTRTNRTFTYDTEHKVVRGVIDFESGETLHFTSPPVDVSGIAVDALLYGFGEKFSNTIGGVKEAKDRVQMTKDLITRIGEGKWNEIGEGGEGSGLSYTLRAIIEVYGQTREQATTFLATLTPVQKRALLEDESLKPAIDKMRDADKAKAKSTVDTSALLSAFRKPTPAAPEAPAAAPAPAPVAAPVAHQATAAGAAPTKGAKAK